MSIPDFDIVAKELARSLGSMRFFADKSSPIEYVELLRLIPVVRHDDTVPLAVDLAPETPELDIALVRIHTENAAPTYQLPIAWAPSAPAGAEGAVLVQAEGLVGYDALVDPQAISALGQILSATGGLADFTLKQVAGNELPELGQGRAMGVEQSNTSVIFDDTVMVKFFRRLHPGTNADVELLSALSRSHSDNVPRLFGWLEIDIDGEVFTTAMLQEFVPNSVDGWKLALGAVRDAVREADTDLELLGTDFALEARALGEAVGRVHHSLAAALPVNERLSGAELVAPMRTRLEFVSTVVPEIAELSDAAEAVFARAEAAVAPSGAVVQRIHGDLHLGQVLRTPRSWLLIDFEGEPSRPWEERRLPDHPLRDIAGMLRSFDYAAHFPLLTGLEDLAEATPRVEAWAQRNIEAFLQGYGDEFDQALLDAFVLDKAIYECLYEAQNRPDWLALPLRAVRALLG